MGGIGMMDCDGCLVVLPGVGGVWLFGWFLNWDGRDWNDGL